MGYFKKSLDAATAPTDGDPLVYDTPRRMQTTVQVVVSGAPSAWVVYLESSLDGSNWFEIARYGNAYESQGSLLAPVTVQLRTRLVTLTGGTIPTVTAYIATEFGF